VYFANKDQIPVSIRLDELVETADRISRDNGWHDPMLPTTPAEQVALLHSEASEFLEEVRARRPFGETYYEDVTTPHPETGEPVPDRKPCGPAAEIADCIIKACEIAGRYDIDVVTAVREKLAFNSRRGYRHGDKPF